MFSQRFLHFDGRIASADGFFDDTAVNASDGPFVGPVQGLIMTKIVQPAYPTFAKDQNIQGEADVVLTVHADGSTSDFSVYRSSGSELLDDAGIAAAKAAAISPARLPPQLGGTLIDVKYLIDYTWALDD